MAHACAETEAAWAALATYGVARDLGSSIVTGIDALARRVKAAEIERDRAKEQAMEIVLHIREILSQESRKWAT